MKTRAFIPLAALILWGLSSAVPADDLKPSAFCRFVPERSGDFAWENDKIAFRAYGPALRDGTENGGVDCWLKRVEYPIINKWYKKHVEGGSYHKDTGEGYDPYHVGASLGCGGIGLWMDGRVITTETFTDHRVIKCEPEESVFELDYAWEQDDSKFRLTKRITIKPGDRLFKTEATFRKNGALATGLPVAVGLTTHEGRAAASKDPAAGWMACWEAIDGSGLGTGVVMNADRIDEYKLIESDRPDESHAILITLTDHEGKVSWWAGYGWERAGEIKTSENWNSYLSKFNQ